MNDNPDHILTRNDRRNYIDAMDGTESAIEAMMESANVFNLPPDLQDSVLAALKEIVLDVQDYRNNA